jgi:hypothetical protein
MKLSLSRRALALLLVSLSFGSAAAPAAEYQFHHHRHRPAAKEIWTRTELYFGSDEHNGSVVSESEFGQFIDSEVTPTFPDGLTVVTGYGQFLDSEGVVEKERSMVLILFYPLTEFDANEKITQIRDCYKKKFNQESVLRVDSLSYVSF